MGFDILFLGRLFPKEKEMEIKKNMKTGMQEAANALQWNIIDGLEANNCGKLKILNYLPVDSYPKGYTDKKIEEFIFQHTNKYIPNDVNVGCNNFTVVKQFVNITPFKKKIKDWALEDNGMKKVLLIYTASPLFLSLSKYVKKVNKDILTACIIADIPEFATARQLHGLRKLYNSYTSRKCSFLFRYVDRFILLTKHMAKKLNITVPYMIMEGIATNFDDISCNQEIINKFKNEKYILYTGILNFSFGIKNLLDAFSKINEPNLKLVICGYGEAENLIKERQKEDSRIVFLGRLERNSAISLQRFATVLVNPRLNNEEFTKYSFPSKNLEYLSSGVPVIAYKLDGIPDEYDRFINYPQDNSPEALANIIVEICNMSEIDRKNLGRAAKHFVLENKNYVVQTKRILDFLTSYNHPV